MFRRVAAVGARIPWGGAADDREPEAASTDRNEPREPTRQSGDDTSTTRAEGDQPVPESGTDGSPPLETVTERRTLADIVDAAALAHWLPAAWTARTTVTKFGEAPVTEVLELSGRGHRLVVDPARTVAPEGPATCYERPAGTAGRRQVATADSLHEALAIALGRITELDEHVDPVMPAERRAAGLSDALETEEPPETVGNAG